MNTLIAFVCRPWPNSGHGNYVPQSCYTGHPHTDLLTMVLNLLGF